METQRRFGAGLREGLAREAEVAVVALREGRFARTDGGGRRAERALPVVPPVERRGGVGRAAGREEAEAAECGGEPEEDALSGDRTGGWIHLENGLRVCHSVRAVSLPRRYASMARAAARPAPMARITVAAPVTASPPAKTPGREVAPCASASIQPRRSVRSPFGGGGDQRVGRRAERHHDHVAREVELRAGFRHGRPAAALVRLAQLHFHAAQAADPAPFVGEHLHGIGEHPEADALLAGVVHLLGAGRKLLLRTAVNDRGLGSEPPGRAHGVHRHVAAAHDRHAAADMDRRVVPCVVGVHQVGARQELVGRDHAVEVLARDAHEPGQSGARADEDRLVALLVEQRIDGHRAAHHDVGLDLHAQPFHRLDLARHDPLLRKAEFGDAIDEHPADLVQGLENLHFVACLRQIARAGQPCGTAADDGDLVPVAGNGRCGGSGGVLQLPVAHEPFELCRSPPVRL